MIDLNEITTTTKQFEPVRMVIYGEPKIGKTTFAAESPSPIILDLEDGAGNFNIPRISSGKIKKIEDLIEVLRALLGQEHSYKTLVIDSLSELERMIHEKIMSEYNAKAIDDYKISALSFGRGFTLAANHMHRILKSLDKLRTEKNMHIVIVSHPDIKKFDDPETLSYDRYKLKVHEKIEHHLVEWSDVIAFAKYKVYVQTEEEGFNKKINRGKTIDRLLCTEKTAAYLAGNRYNLPKEMNLNAKEFWSALNKIITPPQETKKGGK